jgi:hypothetical protein
VIVEVFVSYVPESPVADRVLRTWRSRQDRWIEPEHNAALVVPEAVIAELGLPDSAFDAVAELYDDAIRRAVAELVDRGRELANK